MNLFLRVVAKRPDGYHDLASLFQAIDFGDILTFSFASADTFTCDDPRLPLNDTNLVLKALNLFRKKTGLCTLLAISLKKQIPLCSGLGGGSSNAATTLWGVNALHGSPITDAELQAWSGEIGSDVPFFFSYGTAYCTGRGEIVQNLPPLSQIDNLILHTSDVAISTAEVFRNLKLEECSREDPLELLNAFLRGNPVYCNDLEKVTFRLEPALAARKEQIRNQGFTTVCMTGSGSAFFSLGDRFSIYKTTPIQRQPSCWYALK